MTEHQAIAEPRYYGNSRGRLQAGDRLTSGEAHERPRGTGFGRFPAPRDERGERQDSPVR